MFLEHFKRARLQHAQRQSCITWIAGPGGLGLPYAAAWLAAKKTPPETDDPNAPVSPV